MWFTSSFVEKQFLSSSDLRFGLYDRKHKSAWSSGRAGRHFYIEGENFGSKCTMLGWGMEQRFPTSKSWLQCVTVGDVSEFRLLWMNQWLLADRAAVWVNSAIFLWCIQKSLWGHGSGNTPTPLKTKITLQIDTSSKWLA